MVQCENTILITWLLVQICAQDCIRNPYLIAKLIEVLFVINGQAQVHIYLAIKIYLAIYI